MPDTRPKCVAGARCTRATKDTKKGVTYWYGRKLSEQQRVKCAHPDCDKYACCDDAICLGALYNHYNLVHVCNPLFDLTASQIHSLAHSLTYHFALDADLDVARANHAVVSALPDGIDSSQSGHSDIYNSSCHICRSVLGAFAFKTPDTTDLVCFPCAHEADPTTTPANGKAVRLWSQK